MLQNSLLLWVSWLMNPRPLNQHASAKPACLRGQIHLVVFPIFPTREIPVWFPGFFPARPVPSGKGFVAKIYLYIFDPVNPHFYIVKLELTRVYIIFLIFAENINCGYSLEPSRRGGSNEYSKSMFWAEIRKISDLFLSENIQFLVVKFSIYLNRRVFVKDSKSKKNKKKIPGYSFYLEQWWLIADATVWKNISRKLLNCTLGNISLTNLCNVVETRACKGIWTKPCEHVSSGICGQYRLRSAFTSAQSDQDLSFFVTFSPENVVCRYSLIALPRGAFNKYLTHGFQKHLSWSDDLQVYVFVVGFRWCCAPGQNSDQTVHPRSLEKSYCGYSLVLRLIRLCRRTV